tara:strand:+ start:545 stop:1306 length:762 start_codon:yes stop_codon:yes gene_type:complete
MFRTNEDQKVKLYPNDDIHAESPIGTVEEWADEGNIQTFDDQGNPVVGTGHRIDDASWIARYKYEADLILTNVNKSDKILELGSGPGGLSKEIQHLINHNIEYHHVDRPSAKNIFEKRKYKGTFFVKDLMHNFDVDGLDNDYDLIIINDFLEHIANPHDVLIKCRNITAKNANMVVSVPNWRMGHTFIYRGLFDFDNWLYTMHAHGWGVHSIGGANQPIAPHMERPKLNSESQLPDDMVNHWNWYFFASKMDS